MLRVKHGSNPTFGFLFPDHALYPYFKWLVDCDPEAMAKLATSTLATSANPNPQDRAADQSDAPTSQSPAPADQSHEPSGAGEMETWSTDQGKVAGLQRENAEHAEPAQVKFECAMWSASIQGTEVGRWVAQTGIGSKRGDCAD